MGGTDGHLKLASLAWRIRARFTGGIGAREYLSPDVRQADPGWSSETFNRQIESLEFFLPTGHRIMLSGMEAYNFFAEATQSMSRKGLANGGARLEAIWLCGKFPGTPVVEMWRIGQGQVTRQRKPWGREWGGAATRGWKFGIIGDVAHSLLIKPGT
jgi:hypothetical protein